MLSATIRSRVEPELKNDATEILRACGLDLSTAIRLFLNTVVSTRSLPFEVVPNAQTVAAMEEGRKLSARFDSAEELFKDLEGATRGKKQTTKAAGAKRAAASIKTRATTTARAKKG